MSYQTLLNATNGSSGHVIGSGPYGVVQRGFLEENGSTVPIKMFKLEYLGASKSIMAECEVLRSIRHRNLIKVITTCSSVDYQGKSFKAFRRYIKVHKGDVLLISYHHVRKSSKFLGLRITFSESKASY